MTYPSRRVVLISFIFSFCLLLSLKAQPSHTPNIGVIRSGPQNATLYNTDYIKNSDGWNLLDSATGRLFLLDTTKITIKFFDGVTDSTKMLFCQAFGLETLYSSTTGWTDFQISLLSSLNYIDLLDQVDKRAEVYYVVAPHYMLLTSSPKIPNDPEYTNQWHLQKIDIENAWDISTGSPNITIAVIDGNGVNYSNDDLGQGNDNFDNFYRNEFTPGIVPPDGEEAWTASSPNGDGIDTDGNNKVDDWRGWNFHGSNNSTFDVFNHGDLVASIIAAKTNNSNKISGVAGGWNSPGVKILSLKIGNNNIVSSVFFKAAIEYAIEQNVDLINYSAGGASSPDIQAGVSLASNAGILIIAATGNNNASSVASPARASSVLGVGGTDINDQRAVWLNNGNTEGANYGPGINVSAPAKDVISLTAGGTNGVAVSGTSFATPIVSGIAGLMLSTNECLDRRQVKEIIELTADKVGGYNYATTGAAQGQSNELGYGRVNAFKAVTAAQEMYSSNLDLYLKDDLTDFGQSPSPTIYTDKGPDIWVRNNPDGMNSGARFRQDEQLNYSSNATFYVYVRVRNKSCSDATTGDIALYFSQAGTAFSWPNNWVGTNQPGDLGGLIGSQPIGIIEAGKAKIFEFEWKMSDFSNVIGSGNQSINTCFLARIENVTNNPITPFTTLYDGVKNENNMTMKNVIIRDASYFSMGIETPIWIGGYEVAGTYDILFSRPENYFEQALDEVAEIRLTLDQNSYTKWLNAGEQMQDFELVDAQDHVFQVVGPNPILSGFYFEEHERSQITVDIHFLIDSTTIKKDFLYHMAQKINGTENVTGAVHFIVSKNDRNMFNADAGPDEVIEESQSIILRANDIGEHAHYRWYKGDSLIDTNRITLIHPDSTGTYELEVEASSDGFKDYDNININVIHHYISAITPNPASNDITVIYDLPIGTQSSYFCITNQLGIQISNYNCPLTHTNTIINVSSLSPGHYNLMLICDGQVVSNRQFVKN